MPTYSVHVGRVKVTHGFCIAFSEPQTAALHTVRSALPNTSTTFNSFNKLPLQTRHCCIGTVGFANPVRFLRSGLMAGLLAKYLRCSAYFFSFPDLSSSPGSASRPVSTIWCCCSHVLCFYTSHGQLPHLPKSGVVHDKCFILSSCMTFA
jgi:hypothetical protein